MIVKYWVTKDIFSEGIKQVEGQLSLSRGLNKSYLYVHGTIYLKSQFHKTKAEAIQRGLKLIELKRKTLIKQQDRINTLEEDLLKELREILEETI